MKLTSILSALAAVAFTGTAMAQTTTIDFTGATAFRTGAIQTIKTCFTTLNDIAHTGTAVIDGEEAAGQSIFRGTRAGITGTLVIRATWTGSVEGIRDVAVPQTQNFLTEVAFGQGTIVAGGDAPNTRGAVPAGVSPALPKFAFSDVFATTSPYNVSGCTDTTIGLLPFFCLINEGAPVAFTNMQSDHFGEMMNTGFKSDSYLFGPASSIGINVYATGRNDGSGTRSTYLAASRGNTVSAAGDVAGVVQQWKPTGNGTALSEIRTWPLGDGVNASTVWGPDTAGNGGFNSGGTLAPLMGQTSALVTTRDADNNIIDTNVNLLLCTVLGLSDARTAQNAGARVLAWNGVPITVPASGNLAVSEQNKIGFGWYTLWSYEHLIYCGSLSPAQQNVFNCLISTLGGSLGTAGLPLTVVTDNGVGRATDGAYVTGP